MLLLVWGPMRHPLARSEKRGLRTKPVSDASLGCDLARPSVTRRERSAQRPFPRWGYTVFWLTCFDPLRSSV